MKKSLEIILLALAAGAFSLGAQAVDFGHRAPVDHRTLLADGPVDGSVSPGMKNRRPPSLLMLALDANRDGTISAHEIARAPTELSTLDQNSDGKLTPDELERPIPPRQNGLASENEPRPSADPPPPLMMALDANHDGTIDAGEMANAPAELATLDKNGDGRLTERELQPAPAPPYGGPESDNDLTPNEVSSITTTAILLQLNCR